MGLGFSKKAEPSKKAETSAEITAIRKEFLRLNDPKILIPPIFDFPHIDARTRAMIPAYDLMFGKPALRCLFKDYFEQARHLSTSIMLEPIENPHVDVMATVSGPLDKKSNDNVEGNALFRWQRNLEDPHTFWDLFVSSEPKLRLRSCAYYPKYGFGAFGIYPLLLPSRKQPEDYGSMGFRWETKHLSVGSTFMPYPSSSQTPVSTWLAGRIGGLTMGVQYKSPNESKYLTSLKDLKNWNCAIGYGFGSKSPLDPSFNVAVELVQSSQLIVSFSQHVAVQRKVKNLLESYSVVGITNYIDFGFELAMRLNEDKSVGSIDGSSFQIAASWQANKNFLVKGKLGSSNSSMALAFKSWWNPACTFSLTASHDRLREKTGFGLGIHAENLREPSYQEDDRKFIYV